MHKDRRIRSARQGGPVDARRHGQGHAMLALRLFMAYEDHAGHADISRLEKRSTAKNRIISPAFADSGEARPLSANQPFFIRRGRTTPTQNRPGLQRRPGYDTGSQCLLLAPMGLHYKDKVSPVKHSP